MTKKNAAKPTVKMPKAKVRRITMILDRSGSMGSVIEPTVAGVNKFIEDQKAIGGDCEFRLVQFDDQYEPDVACSIASQKLLVAGESYMPRGMTALLDAIGKTLRTMKAEPVKKGVLTIVVIQTDGLENASREFGRTAVADLIDECRKLGWEFVFLGAGLDAMASAAALHIPTANTMTYSKTAAGTDAAYRSLSASAGGMSMGRSSTMAFGDADYDTQDALLPDALKNKKDKKEKK